MGAKEEKKYEALSPFELKNKLIEMAKTKDEKMMLNAGRGNPNWVTMVPRKAFFQLGIFAVEESERKPHRPRLGGPPEKNGIAKRFEGFLKKNAKLPEVRFLNDAYKYVTKDMKIDRDDFMLEIVDAILGDHYPTPDRMLAIPEKIVHKYLEQEMFKGRVPGGKFDLFATEGGTAAMDYIFSTLMENKLSHKGDKIALGTPIFTPYIEIPRLNDYKFVELQIIQDENNDWQYPDSEIAKLEDPAVKAFFLVHPSNPTSVAMHQKSLNKIAQLVKTKRKDLILLTDDVYGTFVNEFKSLAAIAPYNTILVYSFSKYFGATGWRLGVIGLHENNVFDKMIKQLPEKDRKQLHDRYSTVELDPDNMKLIDRMVADSRSVALHHTAGLSTPQQVQMALFSLYCLIDKKDAYKKEAQSIVKQRFETLYKAAGLPCPEHELDARYYTTIDIPKLAKQRYGQEFASWLLKNHEPIDFVWNLASKKSVVLMDGGGFDAPNMSVRVSLANLPDQAYAKIGQDISDLLSEYHKKWEAK
ncbi:MAG: bifunctional aspartate transaminase/aspartate 4-decarboxylase [Candidatus Margulisbacteria bacterium]|nr:bifunctional aspartate transaminase/aspartate 4-decarboxylase [Candidatus Margulisiibacteriota bacterium]